LRRLHHICKTITDHPLKNSSAQVEGKWHSKKDFQNEGFQAALFHFCLALTPEYASLSALIQMKMLITQAVF
jgi:hypothetical protein